MYLALSLLYWEDNKTTDDKCKSKWAKNTKCQTIEYGYCCLVLLQDIWKFLYISFIYRSLLYIQHILKLAISYNSRCFCEYCDINSYTHVMIWTLVSCVRGRGWLYAVIDHSSPLTCFTYTLWKAFNAEATMWYACRERERERKYLSNTIMYILWVRWLYYYTLCMHFHLGLPMAEC